MKAPTESALVRACLSLLRLRGIFAWRASTTGVRRTTRDGRTFWSFAGTRGVPDILGVLPPALDPPRGGRLLAVEAKAGRGRLSREQAWFLEQVVEAGGLSLVVRDVAELAAALDALPGEAT